MPWLYLDWNMSKFKIFECNMSDVVSWLFHNLTSKCLFVLLSFLLLALLDHCQWFVQLLLFTRFILTVSYDNHRMIFYFASCLLHYQHCMSSSVKLFYFCESCFTAIGKLSLVSSSKSNIVSQFTLYTVSENRSWHCKK